MKRCIMDSEGECLAPKQPIILKLIDDHAHHGKGRHLQPHFTPVCVNPIALCPHYLHRDNFPVEVN